MADPHRATPGKGRPGDDFNARATWEEILGPAGWIVASTKGEVTYWRKPNSSGKGHHATTGFCTGLGDSFYCFTTSGHPFQAGAAYTKFTAYALLNHRGDYTAAARELAGKGYGESEPASSAAEVPTDRPNEAADDPHRLARLFVEKHYRHPEAMTLRYWHGAWFEWTGTAYRPVPDSEIRAKVCDAIKAEFNRVNLTDLEEYQRRARSHDLRRGEEVPTVRKVTQGLVGNVLQALTGLAVLKANVKQPAWVEKDGPFPAEEVLAAPNGLVHLPSLVEGATYLVSPTPRFFSPNVLDYNFEPNAGQPEAWLRFVHGLWPDDPQSVQTLQEWFGYCLLPDTTQQKMLLVVGPRRSGKGTIGRVLTALVGRDNVAGPTLSSLASSFGLAPLLGKTVALISDARLNGRTDAAAITERLLSISGEDTLTVDRKHQEAVTVKLATRFVIMTNELPRVNDASGALAGRMLVLRLTQSHYGKEDPRLTDRLLGELPGILLWAVEGWRRLQERGHFVQPDAGKALQEQMEDLGSPIGEFVREFCEVGPAFVIPKSTLFGRWVTWCGETGREHPGDQGTFTRNLTAAFPAVRPSQPRAGHQRVPSYAGIRVRAF